MPPKKVVKKVCVDTNNTISKRYVKLEQKEHVLTRPSMYIGPIEVDNIESWIVDTTSSKMVKSSVKMIPGLFKIFDEILVNAIDHVGRLKMKKPEEVGSYVKNIKVSINEETGYIEVMNDGDGIEVVQHPDHGIYIPELIFGNLLTSTNYDDSEERVIGGQNGLGAKLCAIFSDVFEVETVDAVRKLHYIQKFENNLSVINDPVITKYTKKPYTIIRFKPDYSRFNVTIGDDIYKDNMIIITKRVYDACAVTDKDITLWLNENKLDYKTFEKYVDLYIGSKDEHNRVYECINDRWEVVASYNDFNGFEQISFVNGIWTIRGGKHVDYIVNQITKKLIEMIQKKKKDVVIRPQFVKDNLIIFVKSTIVNPTFDNQSKETLTTQISKFGSKAEISDKFIDKLYKSGIVEKLMEISTIQGNNEMKKTDGKKKNIIRGLSKLEDANWAGTAKSGECVLILTEGDSGASMAIAGISEVGRDRYGVFPLKGKLMNVKDQTLKKIADNDEISNLKKILGLESGKEYKSTDDLRYGKIMIMADADEDGNHIRALLFNMFHTMWPSLVKCNSFLTSMLTPIVKVSKGKQTLQFYTLPEYEMWMRENNEGKGWEIKYYKGLGTSTSDEAIQYFKELKVINYKYNETTSDEKIDLAFNKKRADDRKAWLGNYDRNNILDIACDDVSYEDFIDKSLIHFSNYDVERSIPNICDGLKVSQRKIMFSCFKKNLTKEIKVAQFAGYVSEHSAYHHGEASLQSAIIGMAQDFMGSNNINLLQPNGQFGTRRCGGKDAGSPRYIFTQMSDITPYVFKKDDLPVLTYLNDDGLPVEPEYYMPIIPMILVNGAIGIGTGFSTNIPCFNPLDIVTCLRNLLRGEEIEMEELTPWYRGFKGTIEKIGDTKYASKGIFQRTSQTKIDILELPVGYWTQDFKEHLEEYIDKNPEIRNYESHYTKTDIKFTLIFANAAACDTYLEIESNGYTRLENDLKLISCKNLGTGNMYLFNSKCQITKYESALHILSDFYDIRLGYFQKRKDHMLVKLDYDIDLLRNKIRFIKACVAEEIKVHTMKKKELEELLESNGYMLHDDSYDYILRIPIYNLTTDKVEELEAEMKKAIDQADLIRNMDIKEWWLKELEEFVEEYNKIPLDSKVKGTKKVVKPFKGKN